MKEKVVLYAEDEENDVVFMRRAFKVAQVQNPLVTVPNGQLVVDYLKGVGQYGDREKNPLPALVMLDLNMPGISGLDVLTWIRSESSLSTLPVLIISSSDQASDIQRAYSLGVNGYVVKPGNPIELEGLVKALKAYWLTYNRTTPVPAEAGKAKPTVPHSTSI